MKACWYDETYEMDQETENAIHVFACMSDII